MRKLILLSGLLAASTGVHAADNGIYFGLSVGRSQVEQKIDVDTVTGAGRVNFDADDMGYKVVAGIRPLDWLGFEANYVNFGELDDERSRLTVSGASAEIAGKVEGYGLAGYIVGFVPVGPVDLFAKAGLVSWDTKLELDEIEFEDRDGQDLAYGVGVQFRLLSLGLRAEYERYDIDDTDDVSLISLGVTYTFL